MLSYIKVEGHHYKNVPTFFEVIKDGIPRSIAWFWNEDDAKEYCRTMSAEADATK